PHTWLEPITYVDLVGLDEVEAQAQILSFVHSVSPETIFLSFFPDKFQRSVPKKPHFPRTLSSTKDIEIFVSYSHKDEGWRKQLAGHLRNLEHQKQIIVWHDRKIGPGREWE